MLKRLAISLALSAALIGPVAGQPVAPEIAPALFVARDADSTMYIFGTVHLRRAGAPWGGAGAQAALQSADEVWTEILISADTDAHARALVARYGMAPEDRPLSTWLSPDENARLAALMQRLGVAPGLIEPMQPWIAALTLSMIPMMQAGYAPSAGVDRALDRVAKAEGKTMRALETVDDQIGLLAALSPALQRQMLIDTIDAAEEGAARLDLMSDAWERGDLDALSAVIIDEMRRDYPELYEAVFTRRNAAWTETLLHELEGAGVDFVAVGAGHLLGEDGLIAMLRARGVEVERVSP